MGRINDGTPAELTMRSGDTSTKKVPAPAETQDPCAGLAADAPLAPPSPTAADHARVVTGFLGCARELIVRDVAPAVRAFAEFKVFVPPVATSTTAAEPVLRSSFSDADLEKLIELSESRAAAFASVENRVFSALDLRRESVVKWNPSNVRLRALLELRDGQPAAGLDDKTDSSETLQRFAGILAEANILPIRSLSEITPGLLHPYAFAPLVLTEPGAELTEISDAGNPFDFLDQLREDLAGSDRWVEAVTRFYAQFRDQDNPGWSAPTLSATKGNVRVAVLDTGFDYVQFPEISRFLSPEGSYDFADGDADPFMPAVDTQGHGTGTAATLLTLLAHYSPSLLTEHRFSLLGWKIGTIRSFLGGPPAFDSENWVNRPEAVVRPAISAALALADPASHLDPAILPDVVSVSLNFQTLPWLKTFDPGILKNLPWLWVMAAGNFKMDVRTTGNACFSDLPEGTSRPSESILCVGALKRGILEDRIAAYSNYGDLVDVYTYDQFIEHCPSGTSCATPAIAFLAAEAKAARPELTAAQIRRVLISAATEKTLEIETEASSHGGAPAEKRAVHVLDPTTDLEKVLEAAKKFKPKKEGKSK